MLESIVAKFYYELACQTPSSSSNYFILSYAIITLT